MIGTFAIAAAAMFTGAAFYINFAEQPARLGLSDEAMLREWKPAYARGFAMQATLAIVGFIAAAATWWRWGGGLWLAGGLVLIANWPFTLLAIMPVNRRLESIDPVSPPPEARALVQRWGYLHAVRTLLGATALALLALAARS